MKNTIFLYLFHLDEYISMYSQFKGLLSKEEIMICSNYRMDIIKQYKTVAYGLRRIVLSKYINILPEEISYINMNKKKEVLGDHNLNFSTSYTDNLMIMAISYNDQVGIDIEIEKKLDNINSMIDHYSSKYEYSFLMKESVDNKNHHFYNLWTAKEAFLKMIGVGIARDISKITMCQTNHSYNCPTYSVFYKTSHVKDVEVVNVFKKREKLVISICSKNKFQLEFKNNMVICLTR